MQLRLSLVPTTGVISTRPLLAASFYRAGLVGTGGHVSPPMTGDPSDPFWRDVDSMRRATTVATAASTANRNPHLRTVLTMGSP